MDVETRPTELVVCALDKLVEDAVPPEADDVCEVEPTVDVDVGR